MNTRRDRAIVRAEEDEQQNERSQIVMGNASAIHNHYHASVSQFNVGHAYNPNFGANYGYQNQYQYQSASAVHSGVGGMADGRPIQPIIKTDIFCLLNPILDASHTRNMKHSPPNSQCLPGTRTKVLTDIRAWADSNPLDIHPHILWLFGYAGCGKSAIAHEIARLFDDMNRLAACFVFFRNSEDRGSTARFATTVASQVAAAIPETEHIIDTTVRRYPGLLTNASASLSDQFKHLVYAPIRAVASRRRALLLIVLDGVDECQDRDEIATLIEDMIKFFDEHPRTPLRILITSRVEDSLHVVLHSSHQVQLLNLVERTSDADIAAALDVAFTKEMRGQVLSRHVHGSWPSAVDRANLVRHIGGSFIFLATIVKRLFDRNQRDGLTPMERLPIVLSMKPDFDELYKEILEPWQHLPHFHNIISTVALAFRPLSVAELADLLSVDICNVVNVLINLHAIIQVPGDDRTPVTLWHTSLHDYLCGEDRAGSVFANPAHHQHLADRCISVTAASINAAALPSSEYSRNYAIEHLAKLAEIMDNHTPSFVGVLCSSMGQLQTPMFKDGQTALEVASCARHWTLVRGLVHANVDINCIFNKRNKGITVALHAACHYNEPDMIYFLMEKGADPNIVSPKKDWGGWDEFHYGTPMAFAAWTEDAKLVTRLLECGANPNLQGGFFNTALQAACNLGSLEMVNLLLENGADPNLRGGFWGSPLHACASSCALALLKHKADTNIRDNMGNTPLHDACYRGNGEVVEYLLKFKADTSIKSNKGQTALQRALDGKQEHIIELLHQRGIVE